MDQTLTMTVPLAAALSHSAAARARTVGDRLDAGDLSITDLVDAIKGLDVVRSDASAAQQEMVNALRESGLTWQRVGDLLGMTRQSAWERWSGRAGSHGRRG